MKYNLIFDSMLEHEYTSEKEWEKYCLELREKEYKLLKDSHYDFLVYKLKKDFYGVTTIDYLNDDCIQAMAIKDGIDMIQYQDGFLGYVSYYGNYTDFLKMVPISKDEYEKISDMYLQDEDGTENYIINTYFKEV